MAETSRLTAYDPQTGVIALTGAADDRQAIERLAAFEDLIDNLRATFDATCCELESLRAQGKIKTVTYRQLSANRATLKETLALFEERGLC